MVTSPLFWLTIRTSPWSEGIAYEKVHTALYDGGTLLGYSLSGVLYAEEMPPISTVKPLPLKTEHVPVTFTAIEEPIPAEESPVSEADIAIIALLTMAEAEGECEEGQRLVIDTVLNRVDDPHFPDNIYDVVYQKNQYSGMQPPRIERCWVKDELVQLVREELENRTDYDVIFFRTERYSDYGVPMFQVEHHYFSSYD